MSTNGKAIKATETEEPYNAGNPEHVRRREARANTLAAVRKSGLAQLMASRESRAWLYGLLETCGVFRSSFTGNSETFMREGQRNVGLMVLADVMRDHDELYITMCREARELGSQGFTPKRLKETEGDTANG